MSHASVIHRRARTVSAVGLALLLVVLAFGCKEDKSSGPPAPEPGVEARPAPAGEVRAISGKVTAQRPAKAERLLKKADPIFADDTVSTAAEASVTIALFHNEAVWSLMGGRSKRVDKSAAWRARKGSAPLLAAALKKDHTVAAGRHSEQEAATSEESATRAPPGASPGDEEQAFTPEPKVAKAAKKARKSGQDDAAKRARRAAIEKQLKTKSVMKVLGTSGKGGVVSDVFKEGGGSLEDAFKGTGGVARSGRAGSGRGIGGLGKAGAGASGLRMKKAERAARARVIFDIDMGRGGLSKSLVARVVQRRQRAVAYCYERALRKNPKLSGMVAVKLVIDQGRVVAVQILKNTIADKSVGKCVAAKMRRWRFPVPKDGSRTSAVVKLRFSQRR